jgi:hypothetical protein
MTLKCPICQSDTEDIYKGRGDVIVLRCSNPDHGEFEISSTIAQSRRGLPLVGSAHWNEPKARPPPENDRASQATTFDVTVRPHYHLKEKGVPRCPTPRLSIPHNRNH